MKINGMDKFLLGFTACIVAVGLMAATSGNIQWTQLASGSRHGTATKGQSSDGTGTSGNCAKYDASGNLVDAGIACASGAGSPLTTKGDLYTYGSSNARQAVGSNGQVLYANSAATNGIDWEAALSLTTTGTSGAATYTPGNPNVLNIPQYSGGSATYSPVGSAACSGGAVCTTGTGSAVVTTAGTTVTFSSIPGTFNNLQLVACGRTTVSATADYIKTAMNGDTTAGDYNLQQMTAAGTGNATSVLTNSSGPLGGLLSGNTATSSRQGCFTLTVGAYAGTTFQKMVTSSGGLDVGASGTDAFQISLTWESASAVTSIVLTPNTGPNFIAGSSFFLYGY